MEKNVIYSEFYATVENYNSAYFAITLIFRKKTKKQKDHKILFYTVNHLCRCLHKICTRPHKNTGINSPLWKPCCR